MPSLSGQRDITDQHQVSDNHKGLISALVDSALVQLQPQQKPYITLG